MFCVTTVGLILSCTVTVAVPVSLFPLASVTVSVTVLAPTLLQSKVVLLKLYPSDGIEQLSVEPLLICAGDMLAAPLASNCTVIFCVTTVGFILSSTVTVAVPVCAFPLASVTVSFTVLSPILLQSKLVLSKESIR